MQSGRSQCARRSRTNRAWSPAFAAARPDRPPVPARAPAPNPTAACKSPSRASGSCDRYPPRPLPNRYGKSASLSSAPSSRNKLNTSSSTSSGRASRPIDLVDDHDRLQAGIRAPCSARTASAASALPRRRPAPARHRPCAPRAPLRRRNRRGPGVSIRLIFTSLYISAMFLARMVMPRSRSKSLRVQNAIALQLAGTILSALAQHGIDQRGFAVVDVGDDGDISNVVATHRKGFRVQGSGFRNIRRDSGRDW